MTVSKMTVRAKFKVDSIQQFSHTPGSATIVLSPVTSGSKENEQFFKWTPSGGMTLSTLNPAAAEQFELGKEYYIDFTRAE